MPTKTSKKHVMRVVMFVSVLLFINQNAKRWGTLATKGLPPADANELYLTWKLNTCGSGSPLAVKVI